MYYFYKLKREKILYSIIENGKLHDTIYGLDFNYDPSKYYKSTYHRVLEVAWELKKLFFDIYDLLFKIQFGKIYNILYTFILVVGRAGVGKLVLVDFGDGVL